MAKANVRDVALTLLIRIEKAGSFSHLVISQAIDQANLKAADEKLLTELVYGTVERRRALDYYLAPFIDQKKLKADWILPLLHMSVFQFVYLDKVPMYAIINEAVNIAKQRGHQGIASLINGVLRNMERKGLPRLEEIDDHIERVAVETSHPTWLVTEWVQMYGEETAFRICQANVTKKPLAVRVNQLKISRDALMKRLSDDGFEVMPSKWLKDAIIICKGNIVKTDYMAEGLITIQDQSSMLAAYMLDVAPGMKVLDACSAPGGKAGYIGEIMENKGELAAHDLHENKLRLIQKQAKRLGITNMEVARQDARKLGERYPEQYFNRILIDAPCSGFGVIRSKPDIKYSKQPEDVERLQEIQLAILKEASGLLQDDGKLVYSTCTIGTKENEEVVQQFLEQHPEFQVDPAFLEEAAALETEEVHLTSYGLQLFPHTFPSDGFFITRCIKRSG